MTGVGFAYYPKLYMVYTMAAGMYKKTSLSSVHSVGGLMNSRCCFPT